ncbi:MULTISPECIES: transcription elongation factor GreA [unclassified Gemella]|uniref:transcription elongation factor GreA n=1 Tax=unclassified Gemella TaxID=2624949 RepID=UPI001073B1D4|nr:MULTISPECIES: transcription elongation factor GreA [unclassified Gemella]MBF0710752.1 transcription elongation factor GreA [Gemella sp. GL1.1]MBF0746679.1 transcription elongation factor GreA [Gemella sp. 19428wG2_WT2a]NYS28096.1 transcription elongation factor GreA [Gemella sp. GL1]TFU60029.1 transcription elongation factor GreA [Gemella sp. WT2a]
MAEEKIEFQMTQEGYDKLVAELDYLKTVRRPEIVEEIKVARSFGDLSENAEYHAAKDAQGEIEQKILELEQQIRFAKIVTIEAGSNVIRLGHTVTFVELPHGEEESYKIVGVAEANPLEAKISNESPIGQALLGKKIGDIVKISLPTGPEASMDIKVVKVK